MIMLSAISLPLAVAGKLLLSYMYYNPRPFVALDFVPLVSHAADNGFPSEHAIFTAMIASILFIFNKKIGVGLFIISIFISIARVYLGLHHSVDVIVGSLLPIAVASLSWIIMRHSIHKSDQ